MKRTLLNLLVDFSAVVLLFGMIATGFIIRFPLPPGTNKSHVLWGLTRHCWGNVHYWISVLLLGVLLLHIVLHWQWIVSVIAKRLGRTPPTGTRLYQIAFITVAVLLGTSLLFIWVTFCNVKPIADSELLKVCPPSDVDESGSSGKPLADRSDIAKVKFAEDVFPILERSCMFCHGPKRSAGGLRLDRRDDLFADRGGGPLIVPGRSAGSPLVAVVSGERKHIPLPQRHKLPETDLEILKAWIDAGAEWEDIDSDEK